MNSHLTFRAARQRKDAFLAGLCLCATLFSSAAAAQAIEDDQYQVAHHARLDPESGTAQVTLRITQPRHLVRSVTFTMPRERFRNIRSDSPLDHLDDQVTWRPDSSGGQLQYDVVIERTRKNGAADSRITESWALLKLDHLFPAASARTLKGAHSNTTLVLSAPPGWSIETPYGSGAGRTFDIDDAQRRFDQPRGWMMAGELGIRRDKIGEHHVSVASPLGSGFRANDTLAFLRWNLPGLIELFPGLPDRLLVVSGSRDMWRGGISGKASFYLHPERPLISGNRTSTLLHELFHVGSRLTAIEGADWIVEGLAEYYSLLLLYRSGGISEYRLLRSLQTLASWGEGVECVATDRSQGQRTAAAVSVMWALDEEIRASSNNSSSLDTLVRQLVAAGRTVSHAQFRAGAQRLVGGPVKALEGCP